MRQPDPSPPAPTRGLVLFALGFRPFYLLAAALAAVSVPLWLAQYFGMLPGAGYLPGMAWHVHEMVFGFAAAVVVGFLFTATPAWTGLPTPTGAPLAALAALWLLGRVLMLTGPGWAAATADVAFLLLAALALWLPLRRSRNRNQFFVGILILFAGANLAFHLAHHGALESAPGTYAKFALFLVVFVVSIMAGRVTPSFTRNAIPDAKVRTSATLDRLALAAIGAALLAIVSELPPMLNAALALVAAALHGVRLWRWDPLSTRGRPILWILHLSYGWIPAGLLLLAAAAVTQRVPQVLALHAFGIGAVGGMIIGMITRTARGHTARPLQASAAETTAYALVHAAALLRVVPPLISPTAYPASLLASAAAWSLAFLIYAVQYWPILSRPRLDGKPG
ncbi:MAG TPA: NnrS family protein [Burkholderiales bacterium]|nr:NnrS family protein [Burkholderiales bacterium]